MASYKLTPDDIQQIKILFESGVNLNEISEMYQVSTNTIKYHTNPAYRQRQMTYDRTKKDADGRNTKKCPRCKKSMAKSVNFCSNCGENLKSKGQLVAEELESLVRCTATFLPASDKDALLICVRKAVALLKEMR